MTYGLTETGPVRKPATEIRADLVAAITLLPGFANVRTTTGSVMGNLIDAFVDELSQVWEAWEASVHAFSRDAASGASLDALLTLVGKARLLAEYSTVDLTLWTTAGSVVPVSEGNQAEQSATGVLWETLEDTEIPAATVTLEDVVIADVAHVTANTIQYDLASGTDLSLVTAGMLLNATGCSVSGNNGTFVITAVNNGSDYVRVTNPNRDDATGDETPTDATAIITDGHVTVSARAIAKGEFTGTAQSIDTINTPVSNWEGVVNLADAVTGRDTEADSALRRRASSELSIAQGSTLEAVKNQLLEVDGVTYVSGTENRTATTDGDGNLPHSQRFVVVGGTDQNIVDCIGRFKAAGIATNGSQSGTYTDPEGVTFTIYFDRVTEVEPFLIVNLTTNADYPSTGDDAILQALLDYSDTLEHGGDLYNFRLIGAAAGANVPGITAMSILQGMSDPPVATTTITIAADELCVLAAENITINS